MINPADARAYYFYTPAEISTARYILKNQGLDRFGNPLYPPTWIKWASKVCTWYGRFLQVLRRYARALSSVALAQVAIWQNLRTGYSVPRMLRDTTAAVQEETRSTRAQIAERDTPGARWINNPPQPDAARNGHSVTAINPKTAKHTRRAQVIRLTNHLQTATQ